MHQPITISKWMLWVWFGKIVYSYWLLPGLPKTTRLPNLCHDYSMAEDLIQKTDSEIMM